MNFIGLTCSETDKRIKVNAAHIVKMIPINSGSDESTYLTLVGGEYTEVTEPIETIMLLVNEN